MTDLRTFEVEVMQLVRVTLDASKFDKAFAAEFNSSIFDAGDPDDVLDDMLGEHAEHIAQLQARGIIDLTPPMSEFVEGYGPSKDMGIAAEVISTDIEITKRPEGDRR